MKSVGLVVPLRQITLEVRYSIRTHDARLIGTTPVAAQVIDLEFQRGKFFGKRESKTRNNVCVIGSEVARKLFPAKNPIGKSILAQKTYFLIVGVLKPTNPKNSQANYDSAVFVPLSTMRSRVIQGGLEIVRTRGSFSAYQIEVSQALMTVGGKQTFQETMEDVEGFFRSQHKVKDFIVEKTTTDK